MRICYRYYCHYCLNYDKNKNGINYSNKVGIKNKARIKMEFVVP